MASRIASPLSWPLAFCVTVFGSATFAQDSHPIDNVFFGFDLVLHPLAIKWACGGPRDQDISQIEKLVAAFPQDAERADLKPTMATLSDMASGLESLPQILGTPLNGPKVKQLCAAALPLNIDWVTPEQLVTSGQSEVPEEQEAAWANFFRTVDGFQ